MDNLSPEDSSWVQSLPYLSAEDLDLELVYSLLHKDPIWKIKTLIESGASVHADSDNPFMVAIEYGSNEAIDYLLTDHKFTPKTIKRGLLKALDDGHITVVKKLLTLDIDLQKNATEYLLPAIETMPIDVIKLLLENGADAQTKNNQPLMDAAINDDPEIVKLLIDYGADINARSGAPLYWGGAKSGNPQVIEALLDAGADIHASRDAALMWSITIGHKENVLLLLERGADIHTLNDDALICAVRSKNHDLIPLLIEHEALALPSNKPLQKLIEKREQKEQDKIYRFHLEGLDLLKTKEQRNVKTIEKAKKHFKNTFPVSPSFSELCENIDKAGNTGLILAAQANLFNDVKNFLKSEKNLNITATLCLQENNKEESLLSILGNHKKLNLLFDPALWTGKSNELKKIWRSMPEHYKEQINFKDVIQGVNRSTIQRNGRKGPALK